jgi:hypothetical protein
MPPHNGAMRKRLPQRLVYVEAGHNEKLNQDNTMNEQMDECDNTNNNNNNNGRSPVEITIIMIQTEIQGIVK